jgi:cbb3-type cytochrome oxidase maturation protein
MTVLFVLIPLALIIVAAAIGGFIWAARRGQFEDLETPALRVLHDDVDRRQTGMDSVVGDKE